MRRSELRKRRKLRKENVDRRRLKKEKNNGKPSTTKGWKFLIRASQISLVSFVFGVDL